MKTTELRVLHSIVTNFERRLEVRRTELASNHESYEDLYRSLEALRVPLSDVVEQVSRAIKRQPLLGKMRLMNRMAKPLRPGMLLSRMKRSTRADYVRVKLIAQSIDKFRWRCENEHGKTVYISHRILKGHWRQEE